MKTLIAAIALAGLTVLGCGEKDKGDKGGDKAPTADAAAAATNDPPATADAGAGAADGDEAEAIPTAEDFEQEAAADITEKNLEKELSQLEEELGE